MKEVRLTVAVATVLRVFLEDPAQPQYGYDLMRQTGFASGKLYPILARLEAAGWILKEREQVNPSQEGRPPRRFYRLTADGLPAARIELATLNEQLRPQGPPRRHGALAAGNT